MKKLLSLIIAAFLLCSTSCFAFTGEGIFDMAYSFDERGYARVAKSDKWGIINTHGEYILEPGYDFIDDISHDLIKFKKGSLYGFLDSSFSEVIAPRYASAEDFSEGFSAVADESGKWGYINANGEALTGFIYDEASSFSDGLAKIMLNEKYGYINTDGEIKIEPAYTESYDFSCGLACVVVDGKYGYIDKDGNLKIAAQYDAAWDFCESLAAVKKDERWSFIDTDGNVKITGNYDRATRFSDGLAPVRAAGGKYGLINTSGNLVIPHKYDFIGEFSEGLAVVRTDTKYGYINEAGLNVIPMLFDRAENFSGGFAAAGTGELCGYIDKTGYFVRTPVYLDAGSYSNGLANVQFENGLWGYTDFSKNQEKSAIPEAVEIADSEAVFAPDIIANGTSVIKLKIGDTDIVVNGKTETLSAPPVISGGRTLLPIRAVVEAAGGSVSWEPSERKVTISYDGGSIILEIGSIAAKLNGRIVPLEVAPEIVDGSTMVPLRFVAENLGMGIKWNGDTSEVTLYF